MAEEKRSIMRSNPEEALRFDEAFEALQRKHGLGKVGMDINSLKSLISSNLDAAHDFVILQCALAQQDPMHIQRAFMVAVLLGMETGDTSLRDQVKNVAASLNLTPLLDRISAKPK